MIAAHLFATLCGVTVLFQIALIAGAPWGGFTQGGRWPGALPPGGRALAALSVLLLVWMALAVLAAAGIGPGWPRWTGWAALGVAVVSAVLNLLTPARGERALWAPVTLVMAALALVVMTG